LSKTKPDSRRLIPVKGYPSMYQKGSRLIVRYYVEGQERKKSFDNEREAIEFWTRTRTGSVVASAERFSDYAETWLVTYTGRTSKGITPSTRASYEEALRRVIVPYFGKKRLDAIKPPDVKAFIGHLGRQGLAPSSVRRYFAPLRALLATAYEDGLIPHNPTARVIVPDKKRKPKGLTSAQMRKLLDGFSDQSDRDLAFFLAATGCRISEALGATWRDDGTDERGRRVINVRKSKTEAGERTITLSPQTARMLDRRRRAAKFAGDDDPIFATVRGTPIDAHNWRQRVFKPAARRAGIPEATPHMLRHGLATLLAEQKVSAAHIAAHLGHADGGQLAMRTYVHPEGIDTPHFVDEALAA
jgi:integrase